MRVNGRASAGRPSASSTLTSSSSASFARSSASLELVALEDHVLGPSLLGLAELRVDRPADCPHRARPALDPDDDPLLRADVVDADEHPLGVPALA